MGHNISQDNHFKKYLWFTFVRAVYKSCACSGDMFWAIPLSQL
jgi:hypothetical protein